MSTGSQALTTTQAPALKVCCWCGEKFTGTAKARYCPPPKGCKQASYRARKQRAAKVESVML